MASPLRTVRYVSTRGREKRKQLANGVNPPNLAHPLANARKRESPYDRIVGTAEGPVKR